MSWFAFVATGVGFAVLGMLLVLLIGFTWDHVIHGDDPEWDQ